MFHDTSDLASGELFLRLRETAPARPEKGWVPSYAFDICLPDGTAAGYCNFRIGHNEKTYYSGNIGYGIDEAYRGHPVRGQGLPPADEAGPEARDGLPAHYLRPGQRRLCLHL